MAIFSSLYKKILHALPTAVIVSDKNGKVRFTNAAFRRYFPSASRKKGELKDVIGCAQSLSPGERCGKASACVNCRMQQLFRNVFLTGTPQTDEVSALVYVGGEPREVSLRMQAFALDKKRCLGLIESVYEQELAKELTNAQSIQQRLLPVGKEAGGVPYAYMYIPCREIGGDLPDVYELDCGGTTKDTFGLLADVSGKGIAAGMLSSFVKAGYDRSEPSPAAAITQLNKKFRDLNLDEKAYITMEAVRIDSDAREICYAIAGHNAPILLKSGENVSEIEMPAPPVSNWFDDYVYEDGRLRYEPRDILVLLTDGVTESRNAAGEQFGIERVETILLQASSAQAFISQLQTALTEFCGTFDDDLTAIAFDL